MEHLLSPPATLNVGLQDGIETLTTLSDGKKNIIDADPMYELCNVLARHRVSEA